MTSIAVDERLPASADVASVVEAAPGTVVRDLGGLGAFSTVSIRGSTARQVEVLLDGIPLNPDGTASVNLAEIPLAALSRVDVYRGNVPVELGAAAVGGVVNLVTGGPSAQATLGVGTLGAIRAGAGGSGRAGPVDLFVVGDATGAQNAFRYLDDHGTVYEDRDDTFEVRDNADRRQASLHVRGRMGDDALQLTVLTALLGREEGVPGFSFAPTSAVRYGVVRDLSAVQLTTRRGPVRGTLLGWVHARRERLDDRAGEIGVGANRTDDTSLSPGFRASGGVAVDDRLALVGLAEVRGDRYRARDLLTGTVDPPFSRTVGRGSAGATWRFGSATVHPAVVVTGIAAEGARLLSADPRLGVRLDLTDQLALTGNVVRSLRPPDLTELVGDRGVLVGNPTLRPERGDQVDLGVRHVSDRIRAELVGFHGTSKDRIVWIQNAQQVAKPVNLDASRVVGMEGAWSLVRRNLESWTSMTYTRSVNLSDEPAYSGKELPRQPLWSLNQRLAIVHGRGRVGYTFSHASATWFDAYNLYRSAPRTLHGAFARALDGPMSVEVEVLNLFDHIAEAVPRNPFAQDGARTVQPVTDFVGLPLPGRTVLLTLRWLP